MMRELIPQSERWHVECLDAGRCIDIESVKGEEAAKDNMARKFISDHEANKFMEEMHLERLKDSVLDRDNGDGDIVGPCPRYDYTYKVAPCTLGAKCRPCYEAGFVVEEDHAGQ